MQYFKRLVGLSKCTLRKVATLHSHIQRQHYDARGETPRTPSIREPTKVLRSILPSSMSMRFLCIDLGDKRTGLALGDDVLRMASPYKVLEVPIASEGGKALLAAVVKEVQAALGEPRSPGELVIGIPFNMDGSLGPKAKAARDFGALVASATGRVMHEQDERLTTADADWKMAGSGLTRDQKKARRDALAAAAILQDFLDQRARPASLE
jgi:putative Holliday junction resolvase